jgi:hypothetical protein
MRYLIVLILSGCAAPIPTYDASKYEPSCARLCMQTNAQCIGASGNTIGAGNMNRVLASCHESTRQCLNTCPAR